MSFEPRTSGTVAVAKRSSGSNGDDCEVVVIGAGPYGLSAAAHLKSTGVSVRVFGKPMDFWATKMPAGMLLRSPRAASNIFVAGTEFASRNLAAGIVKHRVAR